MGHGSVEEELASVPAVEPYSALRSRSQVLKCLISPIYNHLAGPSCYTRSQVSSLQTGSVAPQECEDQASSFSCDHGLTSERHQSRSCFLNLLPGLTPWDLLVVS